MKLRLLLISLLSLSGAAQAVEPPSPTGLLPTEIARPLLEQDPRVAAARASLDASRQEAGILESSPYEWTARTTGQQRRVDGGPTYHEWSLGIERTIRLPGKAAADRNLGQAAIAESQARYGETLHETARELMALWVDWLATERTRELADTSLQSAQASLAAVDKRVRAGDAAKLDASLARAELAEQRRQANDAKTQATAAWSRLAARFPGVSRGAASLPTPLPLGKDAAFWRDRILAESDELKLAKVQTQKAQHLAERARADKLPDPTLGVYTASEVGGRERLTGIMLSLPLPGGARNMRDAKSLSEAEAARLAFEAKKRELEAEIAGAVTTARGAYDSLQIANEGAASMRENADLMQRAYALGEADLQALLLARRQAAAAQINALQAQHAALKTYYGLLVDAHLVWDLEHD